MDPHFTSKSLGLRCDPLERDTECQNITGLTHNTKLRTRILPYQSISQCTNKYSSQVAYLCGANRENLVTRNLELNLEDKRRAENQICFQKSRFFEFTGTNDFSRIQNTGILEDTLPGVFRLIRISRLLSTLQIRPSTQLLRSVLTVGVCTCVQPSRC